MAEARRDPRNMPPPTLPPSEPIALPPPPVRPRRTTPPVAPAPSDPNMILFNQISAYLTDMNLSDLFTVSNGVPGGWLWDQITSGIDDQSVIQLNLESTASFDREYGVIKRLRVQAQTNPGIHVPNMRDVRDYRQNGAELMRRAGLPASFYDTKADFDDLMERGLSLVELEERVGQSWSRVQNSDPLVRQQFDSFFGVQGDAALAAMFLDPGRTLASLERMSRTAYTGGMGQRMGVHLDLATADRIAALPSTDAGIYQDLGTLGSLASSGVFAETFGEGQQDLTAEGTGVDAVFFGGGEAQRDIEKRRLERAGVGKAAVGGAVRTQGGLTGAGSTSSQ